MPRLASPISIPLTLLTLTLALLLAAGCGPTKKGMEARSAAGERVNMVNAQVHFDQARRLFETGDLERALREIDGAIARYDDVLEYHLLRGRILLEMNRLEQSKRSFVQAMDVGPLRAEPHYFAGIINQRWSRHERAHERYRTAMELDGENVHYVLAAAESLVSLGRYDEARSLVRERMSRHEHNAALRHLLGHIALLQGDAASAAEMLQEARLLRPDDPLLLEELAWMRFEAGRYGSSLDAIADLYRMSERHRQRADLRHLEARVLARMQRYVEARRIYVELTQQMPGEPDVWIELAAICYELGDDRRLSQGSIQAMTLAPERHEGYLLRAIYEHERGNLNEAERLLREAIDRAGAHPEGAHLSYLYLGRVYEQQGRIDAAQRAYADARRIQHEGERSEVADPSWRGRDSAHRSSLLGRVEHDGR